jgi:spore coat protein CotH
MDCDLSRIWAWLFLCLLLTAQSRPASAKELAADQLFEPDRLVEVVIELPPEDWNQLCRQTRDIGRAFAGSNENPFTWFKGNVTIDGVKVENVGVRKKGFIGSLDNQFPSLKVKFDEYVDQNPVKGIDVLTLNNNKQDTALVSQFLTYRLFNAAGVQAPRCNFARVTVNGEYLGIYSYVESIGKPFLRRRFGNNSGNLYEGTLADFYPKALARLEIKTNEKNHDRSKVARLADLLAADGELDLAEVEKLVDLDNFLKYWALESLIGFWDGYNNNQNNYWMYEDPDNGKFYFIPWGADMAFMSMRGPFGFGFGPQMPNSIYAESMLANRLYNHPGMADRYRQTMQKLLEDVWQEDELLKSIDRAQALLTEHLHERQAGAPRAMDNTRQFIRGRREAVVAELEKWPVQVSPQPRRPMYTVDVGTAKGSFTTTWHETPAANPHETGDAEVQMELDGKTVTFKQLGSTAQMMQLPRFPFGFGGPGGPPGAGRGGPPDRGGPQRGPQSDDTRRGDAPRDNLRPAGGAQNGPAIARFDAGPFGQFEPPVTIVLAGVRDTDDRNLTLTLTVEPKVFGSSAGKTISVQGLLAEGQSGANPFMPFGGRGVAGTLTLAQVGMNPDDAVKGKFDVKIVETRGGFMDRRGGFGRGGRGPAGPGPGRAGR